MAFRSLLIWSWPFFSPSGCSRSRVGFWAELCSSKANRGDKPISRGEKKPRPSVERGSSKASATTTVGVTGSLV
jgi:hypothetical protein